MNLPLGIDEDSTYDQFIVRLRPRRPRRLLHRCPRPRRWTLRGPCSAKEGFSRSPGASTSRNPINFGPALLEAIRDHRAGIAADDDVTLLVLHHNGGPPRKPSMVEKLDIYAKVFGLKKT